MISPPNNKFVFSPDLLLAQHHDNLENFGGLISPNFVGNEQRVRNYDSEDGETLNIDRKKGGRNNKRPFMTLQGKSNFKNSSGLATSLLSPIDR